MNNLSVTGIIASTHYCHIFVENQFLSISKRFLNYHKDKSNVDYPMMSVIH